MPEAEEPQQLRMDRFGREWKLWHNAHGALVGFLFARGAGLIRHSSPSFQRLPEMNHPLAASVETFSPFRERILPVNRRSTASF